MPTVIPPSYSRAAYRMSSTGDPDPHIVTMGWHSDIALTQALADGFADAFASSFKGMAPNEVTFLGVTITEGQAGDPRIWEGNVSAAHKVGTSASDFLPQNCSTLVQKKTGLGGRKHRGRFYWPYTRESDCDQVGNLNLSWTAAMDTQCVAWLQAMADLAGVITPVILHAEAGLLPTHVTLLKTSPTLATQRRRLR